MSNQQTELKQRKLDSTHQIPSETITQHKNDLRKRYSLVDIKQRFLTQLIAINL